MLYNVYPVVDRVSVAGLHGGRVCVQAAQGKCRTGRHHPGTDGSTAAGSCIEVFV